MHIHAPPRREGRVVRLLQMFSSFCVSVTLTEDKSCLISHISIPSSSRTHEYSSIRKQQTHTHTRTHTVFAVVYLPSCEIRNMSEELLDC
jgi:hypothetical protein